jgi:hypothetical protein
LCSLIYYFLSHIRSDELLVKLFLSLIILIIFVYLNNFISKNIFIIYLMTLVMYKNIYIYTVIKIKKCLTSCKARMTFTMERREYLLLVVLYSYKIMKDILDATADLQ